MVMQRPVLEPKHPQASKQRITLVGPPTFVSVLQTLRSSEPSISRLTAQVPQAAEHRTLASESPVTQSTSPSTSKPPEQSSDMPPPPPPPPTTEVPDPDSPAKGPFTPVAGHWQQQPFGGTASCYPPGPPSPPSPSYVRSDFHPQVPSGHNYKMLAGGFC